MFKLSQAIIAINSSAVSKYKIVALAGQLILQQVATTSSHAMIGLGSDKKAKHMKAAETSNAMIGPGTDANDLLVKSTCLLRNP